MIKIAICDDNIEELAHMAALMEDYKNLHHTVYEYAVFHNGFELISVLEKGKTFDIYCLDIIMPGFNGISAAAEIRSLDKTAQIIFFTSSSDYALESYSVNAINYVLKPVTKEKLFFTLTDVLERMENRQPPHIIVKSSDGIQKILLSNLLYIEAMGKKVLYHLLCGNIIECTESFQTACDSLTPSGCFMKPHRSFLVNMCYIDTIGNNDIALQTGALIPIAQRKSREMKEYYLAFQMKEV